MTARFVYRLLGLLPILLMVQQAIDGTCTFVSMEEILRIDSIAQYNSMRGLGTKHPLVSVIDISVAQALPTRSFNFGLYAVGLKEQHYAQLRYGRRHYDYQEGSLVFIAPGQVVGVEPGVEPDMELQKGTGVESGMELQKGTGVEPGMAPQIGAGVAPSTEPLTDPVVQPPHAPSPPKGHLLLFHPDLIKGTPLGRHIQDYSFFSYDVNEALHLSEKEKSIVMDCFSKIGYELDQNIDKHSKRLIAANIELLLSYCIRFYDRQFITRDHANKGILERFEYLLKDYFSSDKPQSEGLPSVAYCAAILHLSPNYFGDLVKKETGRSAQEYIQSRVIDMAKERVFDTNKSVSEIAYELGFKYPQHFTRLFKQKVGVTPNDYRMMN